MPPPGLPLARTPAVPSADTRRAVRLRPPSRLAALRRGFVETMCLHVLSSFQRTGEPGCSLRPPGSARPTARSTVFRRTFQGYQNPSEAVKPLGSSVSSGWLHRREAESRGRRAAWGQKNAPGVQEQSSAASCLAVRCCAGRQTSGARSSRSLNIRFFADRVNAPTGSHVRCRSSGAKCGLSGYAAGAGLSSPGRPRGARHRSDKGSEVSSRSARSSAAVSGAPVRTARRPVTGRTSA